MSQPKHPSTSQSGEGSAGVMTEVPSGVESDIYYILFCNIKKDTTWKDVKDFLRGGKVEVDNVAVFPNAQNGWVRVFSRRNYDAAINRFRTAYFKGGKLKLTDNAEKRLLVRDVKGVPTGAETGTHEGAFSTQIPPLAMSGSSPHVPQNVSMSYTNPYVTSSGTGYNVPKTSGQGYGQSLEDPYDQKNYEYSSTHPTQSHSLPPAQKTGYEGAAMYAAHSRDIVDNFGAMSVQQPSGETPTTGSAAFRLTISRCGEGLIDEKAVIAFVQSFAPMPANHILRVDLAGFTKTHAKHRTADRAVVLFDDPEQCALAREGMLNHEVNGMKVVQSAADDYHGEKPASGKQPAQPEPPRAKPEGSDHRTRKDKQYDRRLVTEANVRAKLRREAAEDAASARGSSSSQPGEGSTSRHTAPVASGSFPSRAKPMDDSTADGGDASAKGKEKDSRPLVVDGRNHKHKREERKRKQ